jgi:hypothetical protein
MKTYVTFLVLGVVSVLADIQYEIRKLSDDMELVKSEILSLQEKIRLVMVQEADLREIARKYLVFQIHEIATISTTCV